MSEEAIVSITWGELWNLTRRAKPLHDAYYTGQHGRPLSGYNHLELVRWTPPVGIANVLVLAQDWLYHHVPSRYAEAAELLKLIDWSKRLVAFVEVEVPDGACFICDAEVPVEWETDKLGRKPLPRLAFGGRGGIRHLQHRLAATETEQAAEPTSPPEPWYPKWTSKGGSGDPCFITWNADGTPVERATWEVDDVTPEEDAA